MAVKRCIASLDKGGEDSHPEEDWGEERLGIALDIVSAGLGVNKGGSWLSEDVERRGV